jgi:hypothetical protein
MGNRYLKKKVNSNTHVRVNMEYTIYNQYRETEYRARICKRLRSTGIDSKESIPPAYALCSLEGL